MIYIIAIHMEPSWGSSHEHIAAVRWQEANSGTIDQSTTSAMVKWINEGGEAHVQDQQGSVKVEVVNASPPYLRTRKDGRYTDNLLSLSKY